MPERTEDPRWQPSACILCECNCGLEVELGGTDGRRLVRVRGDDAHPASQGYACEKASRIDYYQNGPQRLTKPLRRRPDGGFDEMATRAMALAQRHGGSSILYYGGGGQGNHLPSVYSRPLRAALGMRYQSSALAQEKTGAFYVAGSMLGGLVRADFEHCEVALLIGKNPWHSHGIARARVTLRENLYALQRRLTASALMEKGAQHLARLGRWMARRSTEVEYLKHVLIDMRTSASPDFATLSVALQSVRRIGGD
jgi:anaerobic selenocysteine-containing dehydrogenase